ncbi:hypothetical protein [Streptomyces sp. NPDC001286]
MGPDLPPRPPGRQRPGLRSLLNGATYSVPASILLIIGFLAVSLLGGWLLYRFVEMPAMRRFSRSRRTTEPATAEPRPTSLRAL